MEGKLVVLVGLPGSGKSTWAKQYAANCEKILLVSSDAIREELWGSEEIQGNPKVIFAEMQRRTEEALKSGKTVVYDATNIERKFRKELPRQYRQYASTIVCVVFNTPLEECIKRNTQRTRHVPESVIRKMAGKMDSIEAWEGFDEVTYINP